MSKLEYARLIAAALSHLVAGQGDAVGLVTFDGALRDYIPSRAGPAPPTPDPVALSRLQASGGTSSAAALRRAIDLLKRRGLLLLISDLYDEGERSTRSSGGPSGSVTKSPSFTCWRPTRSRCRSAATSSSRTSSRAAAADGCGGAKGYQEPSRVPRGVADDLRRYGIDYTRVTTAQPLDAALRGYLPARTRSAAR